MENKYIMILDTETNGLPKMRGFNNYYPPWIFKYYDTARLIELAYIIYNKNGDKIKEVSNLVTPIGFNIRNSEIHGITEEMAFQGKNIKEVFEEFKNDLKDVEILVAHNISFDINILLSEFYRQNNKELINIFKVKQKYCTMKKGMEFMKFYKYPKLIELYEFIYNEPCIQHHRALSDVVICSQCFFRMI
jgi:DNA polymerase III epsilon subunit-like protein